MNKLNYLGKVSKETKNLVRGDVADEVQPSYLCPDQQTKVFKLMNTDSSSNDISAGDAC